MNEIKIAIFQNGNKNELKLKSDSLDFAETTTNKFFEALGMLEKDQPIKFVEIEHPEDVWVKGEAEIPLTEIKTVSNNHSSKTLKKVNEERTLSTSIAELVGQEDADEKEHEHWHTGIKLYEGENRYQCYYWCPCSNRGKRFIKESNDYVHCHECNEKLTVEPATELGFPNRDHNGNFFIATKHWGEQH